jgi:hypothetical protein
MHSTPTQDFRICCGGSGYRLSTSGPSPDRQIDSLLEEQGFADLVAGYREPLVCACCNDTHTGMIPRCACGDLLLVELRGVCRKYSRLLRELAAGCATGDFLDDPGVAVGILESDVGAVAFALGVWAADASGWGERRAVEYFSRGDAAGH